MTTSEPTGVASPAAEPAATVAPARCVNCGAELATPFCPRCGERRASDRHYTLRNFGDEVLETFTHLDGTLWRTLRTLLTRPGELTAAYMRGERLRYMKPLQLFVVVSIVHFFVAGHLGVRTFDVPLRVQSRSYTGPARMIARRLAERNTTFDAYAEKFDTVGTAQAKTLIIAMVPAFALLLALLELRKRRYALEHLVFGMHTYAALLTILILVDATVYPALGALQRARDGKMVPHAEAVISNGILVLVVAYLAPALRRNYADRWVAALSKSIVLVCAMVMIVFAYRILLFYTTYWAT